jgi:hypothetical protein
MNPEGGTLDRRRIVLGLVLLMALTLMQAFCVQFCWWR